jgi:5S rRNA maturation endonuclease (ribonuclease M5)
MNQIDIRAELEEFSWTRPQWHADKLIAASPFRYDHSPSFYVYLEDTASASAGNWGDSGAYDAEWAKGGIVKLLAFLHNETEEETTDYLRDKYEVRVGDTMTLNLPALKLKRKRQPLTNVITPQVSPYLSNRGITEDAQRLAGVGFDGSKSAVLIPWRLPNGKLANIKYRATWGKAFWYEKGGIPIRELVYGIDRVYRERLTDVVLCEAEIDALTWESAGVRAIAVGGANFTDSQADVIKRSPIESLTICADNDKAGEKLRNQVVSKLGVAVKLSEVRIPHSYKDVNEAVSKGFNVMDAPVCKIVSTFDVKF